MNRIEQLQCELNAYVETSKETGGMYNDVIAEIGIDVAYDANQAFDMGDTELGGELVDTAALAIGRATMGALELQAYVVWRSSEAFEKPEGFTELMREQAALLDMPTEDMSDEDIMLMSAQVMHLVNWKRGLKGIMPPIELWNKEDIIMHAVSEGGHPLKSWIAQGMPSDDIDSSLYVEWNELNRIEQSK